MAFLGMDHFSALAGGCHIALKLGFTANMDKKMLFLACRSVRNSLLKFLVNVLGPQTWHPSKQIPNFFAIWFPDLDFFQGLDI